MQKYKFSNPASVVAVSISPLNKDPQNPLKIYDCSCHLFRRRTGLHKMYHVTAATPSQAARKAVEMFRKDYGAE